MTNWIRASNAIKDLEWILPLPLQSVLLKTIGRRYIPYTEWNHQHEAIFIHVPRTAGTSMARTLGVRESHFAAARYAAFDRESYERYFKFAFVRNPWDRLLSAYTFLMHGAGLISDFPDAQWARANIVQYPDFESFVLALADSRTRGGIMRYIHFRAQRDWLTLPRHKEVKLDFVGRFEFLERDFGEICSGLGVKRHLQSAYRTEHPPYRESYSSQMREIVAELYAADIEAFDYSF